MTTKAIPTLEYRPARSYVGIPVEASLHEWNRTIDAIPKLFAWIEENGVTPAGALFYRYRVLGDTERRFQVEIGITVSEPVEGSGEVVAGTIPEGTYASYVHHGHPDQLFQVNDDIETWAAENGIELDIHSEGELVVWTGRFEFFLTNPEEEPNPNNWFTEVAYLTRNG